MVNWENIFLFIREGFTSFYLICQNRKIRNFKSNRNNEFMGKKDKLLHQVLLSSFLFPFNFFFCWLQLQYFKCLGNYFKMGFSRMLVIVRAQIMEMSHQAGEDKWRLRIAAPQVKLKNLTNKTCIAGVFRQTRRNSPCPSGPDRVQSGCLSKLSPKPEKLKNQKVHPWNTILVFDYQNGQFWACWQFFKLKRWGKNLIIEVFILEEISCTSYTLNGNTSIILLFIL